MKDNHNGSQFDAKQWVGVALVFSSLFLLELTSWLIFGSRIELPHLFTIVIPLVFVMLEVGEAWLCTKESRDYPFSFSPYILFIRVAIALVVFSNLGVGLVAVQRLMLFAFGTACLMGGANLIYSNGSYRTR